jgi:PadR family transcriptional regulator PadR
MTLFDTPEPGELVVLSLLAEGRKYGYMLSKEAAARSEGRLRLTPGALYPLLKQLERQGLIASTVEEIKAEDAEPDASGRKRKWYRLTPKGKRRLEQRVQAHRTWRGILDAFLPEDPLDSTHRSRG